MVEKLHIASPDGADEFQLRLLKDEGVGLATTRDGSNFLLLDSIDYWFDIIQDGYPKVRKCGCGSQWFTLEFDFVLREGTDDFRGVEIMTTCVDCGKTSVAMSVDIDYSPTAHLAETPLTFCAKPKVKYKLSEYNSYWLAEDRQRFIEFMMGELGLFAYCYGFDGERTRFVRQVILEEALELSNSGRYNSFYFSITRRDMEKLADQSPTGVYFNLAPWRREEIIELAHPLNIIPYGQLHYVSSCTQYLEKGEPIDKSQEFHALVGSMTSWLQSNFVTHRGKNCYDGVEAFEKFEAARRK